MKYKKNTKLINGVIKLSYGNEREMHKVTCADCGNEAEVPFKPKEDRPVYCRECFQKHRKPRTDRRF